MEVFTVNYDLLVETAFEHLRLPDFDGFVGNLQGKFHTDLVEGTPEEPERWLLRSLYGVEASRLSELGLGYSDQRGYHTAGLARIE